jgi:hypothetical protein
MENKTKFITLRIAPELHERLKFLAKAENRTISGQINYILDKNLGKTPTK